ncbi:MAG: twin-arginine translocase subunit TatB [Gammaproteobacteria bacterium]|nr:twin-arginine translocase subunit TatB [Gammaproteobacteria bacterium]
MFDVGFWEILLIVVLALVVIGPERLPGAARQAGLFIGKARRYIEGVRSEVESELDINEFKRMMHNQEVQINELQQQLKSGVDDVKSSLPDISDSDVSSADIPGADILDDTTSHSSSGEGKDDHESSDKSLSDLSEGALANTSKAVQPSSAADKEKS